MLDGPVEDGRARLELLGEALRAEEDAWPGEDIEAGSFTRALRAEVARAGGQTNLDAASLIEAATQCGEALVEGVPLRFHPDVGVSREHGA